MVSLHSEGRYAFVELRTSEMATASLQLNGQVQLLGQVLSIGRPSGYVDPGKAAHAAHVAAEALAKFQVGGGGAGWGAGVVELVAPVCVGIRWVPFRPGLSPRWVGVAVAGDGNLAASG